MTGVSGRQPFTSRLQSSARRGANVPAGVPGVYRVPRVRTVTVQGNDRGSATASNPWVQPDDLEFMRPMAWIGGAQRNEYFDDSDLIENRNGVAYNAAPDNYPIAGTGHGGLRWVQSAVLFVNVMAVAPDAITEPDDVPDGMTVEYEAAEGTLVTDVPFRLVGRGYTAVANDSGYSRWGATLRDYSESGYSYVDFGPPYGEVPVLPTIEDADDPDVRTLYGGTEHASFPAPVQASGTTASPGLATLDYDIDIPAGVDAEGWRALFWRFDADLATVKASIGTGQYGGTTYIQALDLYGTGTVSGGTAPALAVTFRPPRYRFV